MIFDIWDEMSWWELSTSGISTLWASLNLGGSFRFVQEGRHQQKSCYSALVNLLLFQIQFSFIMHHYGSIYIFYFCLLFFLFVIKQVGVFLDEFWWEYVGYHQPSMLVNPYSNSNSTRLTSFVERSNVFIENNESILFACGKILYRFISGMPHLRIGESILYPRFPCFNLSGLL